QPGGGRIHRRPHHGDVRRALGRDGAGRPVVPEPGPSLYSGVAGGSARPVLDLPAQLRPIDGRKGFHPIGLAGALYHRPGSPAGYGGSLRRTLGPRRYRRQERCMKRRDFLLTSLGAGLVLGAPAAFADFIGSAYFKDKEASGDLPPVAERLPKNPA